MAAGDAVAGDCPGKYDVVINGKGYCLYDALESSIPFRTHRAIYGQTQPFVERQNVSNSYGDNAQDFFLTIRQRDWSLGEQQKYFRAGQDGRYWMGSNVDVTVPGQVVLSPSLAALSVFPGAVMSGTRTSQSRSDIVVTTSTALWKVDPGGVTSNLGNHGLGATPSAFGMCGDGLNAYMSTTTGGTVGVRKWDGASFSTFSATPADSLSFLNNTLFGLRRDTQTLLQYDTAGTATTLFTWKSADGNANGMTVSKTEPFGGQLLILLQYGQDVGGELWVYDGTGTKRLEVFPSNFLAWDVEVLYGVAYVSGTFSKPASATTAYVKPAILFYDGSQIGKLWEANAYTTSAISLSAVQNTLLPAIGVVDGRVIFNDDTTGGLMAYNPALGGVSSIGTSVTTGDSSRIITAGINVVYTRNQTTAYIFPSSAYPASGYVISSLVDFDSSLAKIFRGVTIEFDAATDGDGGSVDVSYQLNGLGGAFTSLATGIASGTEVLFPAATSGHSVAFKITLNKGTSTAGPTVKSMSVRGAPVMPIYPRGEYVIDCTGSTDQPRELRDGSLHPLTGYDQVANLITARNSATPITITDKVNGTFVGYVDVNDPQGFDAYEVRSGISTSAPAKPASYVVRLTVRGV